MKITDINVRAYSAKFPNPISNGKYTYTATEYVFAEVLTDDGVTGIGWAHGNTIVMEAMTSLRERVVGQDPFNVERIWEKMYLPKVYGRKSFATRAISAIDIAMWDIMGKVAGRSVRQLLGGYADSIPAYVAGGYYGQGKGHDGLREEMKANLASGAKAIKMKIGAVPVAEDVERIDVVREVVGRNVEILVDANNAYNRIDALKMGKELDKRNIYWFEEPLSPDDLEGCAELRRRIDTPIAVGENEYTRWGFKQLLDAGVAQVLNADAQVLGGITEWKKVADLAMAAHVMVAPHGCQEIHAHLVSAIPNGLIAEFYDNNTNAMRKDMFANPPMALDAESRISAPDRPGLGVEINWEAIEKYNTFSSVRK